MSLAKKLRPLPRHYTRHLPFTDRIKVLLSSGTGGDGASIMTSLHSNEFAGPGGGNGGRGGNVVVRCNRRFQDLAHIGVLGSRATAGEGIPGREQLKIGKSGDHLELDLPLGTQIIDVDTNETVFDLDEEGTEMILLEGGQGGKGNAMFANRSNHSPKEATKGLPGNTMLAQLELKMIADCGLVGLPNAGKSTILNAVSSSKPKIAPYPFTTIHPLIGKIHDMFGNCCDIADLPGLIEGAYENRGLGHQFLRHVERTHAIVLVVDMVTSYSDDQHHPPHPWDVVEILMNELEFYLPGLSDRVVCILANKMDVEKDPDGVLLSEKHRVLQEHFPKVPVFPVSAAASLEKGTEFGGLAPALHHLCREVFAKKRTVLEHKMTRREEERKELEKMFAANKLHSFNEMKEEDQAALPDEMSLVDQQFGDGLSGFGESFDAYEELKHEGQFHTLRDKTLRGSSWNVTRDVGEKLSNESWR